MADTTKKPRATKKTVKRKTVKKPAPKTKTNMPQMSKPANKSPLSVNSLVLFIGMLILSGAVIFNALNSVNKGSDDFQDDVNDAIENYIKEQEAAMQNQNQQAEDERLAAEAAKKANIESKAQELGMDRVAEDDPFLGAADAPVTIVEFSDYQCPFCNSFRTGALTDIKEKYIDKGLVKLVYRDLPLRSIHPQAFDMAMAMECIDEQSDDETYFAMHDYLFENNYSESSFINKALEFGLNEDTLSNCITNDEMEAEVLADMKDAQELGITATPAFIINGKFLSGAGSFSTRFEPLIEEALNQ